MSRSAIQPIYAPSQIIFTDGGLDGLAALQAGLPSDAAVFVLDPAPNGGCGPATPLSLA